MAHSDKHTERQRVQGIRKEYRAKHRTARKSIRQDKDLSRSERKFKLGASKAYHKVNRQGVPGGFIAFGKYHQKQIARTKKRADRKALKTEKRASRVAARERRKTLTSEMKTKQGLSTSTKANKQFWLINAKNRGMKLNEYYDKYVK